MAQALFDALAGNVTSMDSQTALAVQSLLESQTVHETTPQVEDDDVFQCGKCKKQFTSLAAFVDHKQNRCIPLMPRTTLQQSTAGSAFTASIPHAIHRQPIVQQTLPSFSTGLGQPSLTQLTSNMVLTDEQMLTFGGVDQSALLHTSTFQLAAGNPTVQATGPFLSQVTHLAPRVSNNVTILSPIQNTATLASNGSAFTSTVNNLQPLLQQHAQQITIATLPEKPQTVIKPSPTKAGRKTAQANLISVLEGENGTLKQRRSRTAGITQLDDPLGRKKLRCQYCDKAFSKNFDLQQHIRSHTGERPFQCIVCGRAFAQKSNVKKHMSTHKVWPGGPGKTLPKQPPAEIIVEPLIATQEITAEEDNTVEGSTTGSAPDLLPSQSDNSLQQSEETQEGFSGYGTLDDGQLQQEQEQPLQHEQQEPPQQNTLDGMTQLGDSDIKKDLKLKVVIDNTYLCQYCNLKFETYFRLKSHMTQHKNEQVYKCVMKSCNATFKDLDSFLDHTSAHKEEMTYRCHHCNKFFSSLYDLGVHQYSHSLFPSQGPKTGPRHFQCNKCMNKYSTPEALEHHMTKTLHSFNCPHCEKVFTCERYLRRHLPTHGTEGQFKCDTCQKAFKTEHYLKMHHFIHSGEKPFVCEICGAAFNRKDKLKRHDAIHNKKIRYKCPFKAITGCSKEFNRPDKLKAHIISHSGVKPFVCPDCGKGFARRPHLQEHIKAHRAEFKFKCEHCGRGFFRSKLFNDHKCKPRKDGQPRVFKPRLYKRKAGRPRKKMITVTEEMVKQNAENREPKKRGRPRLHPVFKENNKNDASKNLQGNVALSENASLEQSTASNLKGDKTITKSAPLGTMQTANGVYIEPSSEGMEMGQTDYSEIITDSTFVTNENEVEIFKRTLISQTDSDLDPKHSDRQKARKSKVECYVRTAPPISVVEHFVTVHLTNAAHGSGNAIQTHLIPTGTTTQILSPSSHTAFQPITIIETPTVHITVPASVSVQHDQIAALTTSASMEGIPVDIVTVSEEQAQEITSAESTGPTYVTCETTMEDYVAETGDPVLQGTESLLNASAEILRSAQQTSEHQL